MDLDYEPDPGVFDADVHNVLDRINRILDPESILVQGAVTAALMARFIERHYVPGDRERTAAVREELLQLQLEAVRSYIDE